MIQTSLVFLSPLNYPIDGFPTAVHFHQEEAYFPQLLQTFLLIQFQVKWKRAKNDEQILKLRVHLSRTTARLIKDLNLRDHITPIHFNNWPVSPSKSASHVS